MIWVALEWQFVLDCADKLRTMTDRLPGRFPVPALVPGGFGRLR
jgi:hypothetical protein